MTFLLLGVAKDISRWLRDPVSFVIYLLVPLLVGGLLTAVTGQGPTPTGTLLVADEDRSMVSRLLVAALFDADLGDTLRVEKSDEAGGRELMNTGDASALLILPDGFGEAFLRQEPTALVLVTNPSEAIMPRIIREGVEIVVDAGFYFQALLGDETRAIYDAVTGDTSDDVDDSAAAEGFSADITAKVTRAAPRLLPPALTVELVEEVDSEEPVPLALLMFPGIIMMAMVLTAQGLSADLWSEAEAGTVRRIAAAPQGFVTSVAGKAIAAGVLTAGVSLVIAALGFVYYGLEPWLLLPVAGWLLICAPALYLAFSLIQLAAPDRRAGAIVSSIIMFPLLMAGGSFFPLEQLPEWIAAIGRFTPNGFMLEQLSGIVTTGRAGAIAGQIWVAMALAGLGLFVLASFATHRRFAHA